MENKWIKELVSMKKGVRTSGTVGAANDPIFSTIREINFAFQSDILQRKKPGNTFVIYAIMQQNGRTP